MGQEDDKLMPPGHLERYHPHGIKEGDTCKYLEGVKYVSPNHKSKPSNRKEGNAESFNIQHVIKSSKGENEIQQIDGISWYHPKTDIELYPIFKSDIGTANALAVFGKPVSREQHHNNLVVFSNVINDFKTRFPRFSLGNTFVVSWDLLDKIGWYAFSTLDKRKDVISSFISFGRVDEAQSKFWDKAKYDIASHIVRHEIGHNLSTDLVAAAFRVMRANLEGERKRKFEEGIFKLRNIQARKNEEEAIAEIFALYTDPEYAKGTLPIAFENLAELMLGNNTTCTGITMDKGISDKDMLKIHPLYLWQGEPIDIAPKGEISWYDPRYGKYLVFETGAEMLRQVLPIYQIKRNDIERIIQSHPDREWTSWDMSCIINSWLYLDKTIDDIISEVEQNSL